jgi:hypothetical protein
MQKYNSDLISIETFVENSSAIYSLNNKDVDRINGKILSRVEPKENYNEKFDVNKIYLGNNIVTDPYLTPEDKKDTYDAIYFKVKSEIDIENIEVRLLINESMFNYKNTNLEEYLVSDKDNFYFKITKEELYDYYDKYTLDGISGNGLEYYNGSAFLHIGIDPVYSTNENFYGRFNYSMISLFSSLEV